MKNTVEFLENLIEDLKGVDWYIDSVIQGTELIKNDKKVLLIDDIEYEEQSGHYISQWKSDCENSYIGVIFYPITENKYLKISYCC